MSDRLYYRVGPGIWNEPWTDDERLVAVYLLTCPHRNTEGLFKLPKPYMYADLGWDSERVDKAFDALIAMGFIEWDDRAQVVWIVAAMEWQPQFNENQAKASVKRMRELPPTRLFEAFLTVVGKHSRTLSKAFADAGRKGMPFALALAHPQPLSASLLSERNAHASDVEDQESVVGS
ncbi:MAG TPA: hypothetical protein VM493_07905 [Vicinamibacterales bacterium]|nr:hypothetical protein [Vicinamibacterales bacterium]